MVRTKEETAFAELYETYGGRVFAYCVRRMRRDDAFDAAAEVFTVAWRRFDKVPQGEAALPWLYGVAGNIVKNHRRSRRRAGNLTNKLGALAADTPSGPERHMLQQDERRTVREAIERLGPKYREVLRLVEWEGLSRPEAADLLHISRAAVDQRMHRAYHQLESELANSGVSGSGERTQP